MAKKLLRKIRGRWDAYLKRLGEANKKTFGEGPLDCCGLNRDGKDAQGAAHHAPH